MESEFVKILLENGGIKALLIVVAYFLKNSATKLDKLAGNVAKIHQDLALIVADNTTKERRILRNETDIIVLRDKTHNIVNNHVSKIELNRLRIDALEERASN